MRKEEGVVVEEELAQSRRQDPAEEAAAEGVGEAVAGEGAEEGGA